MFQNENKKKNNNVNINKKMETHPFHNHHINVNDELLDKYYNNINFTSANQITTWVQYEDIKEFNYPKYRTNYLSYLSTLQSNWSYKIEFDDSALLKAFINKTLVRAAHDKSIWLIKNDELHLINNIDLFVKLGFDFSDVVAIDDKSFNYYHQFHLGTPCTFELCSN
jgi:hypothetical protein